MTWSEKRAQVNTEVDKWDNVDKNTVTETKLDILKNEYNTVLNDPQTGLLPYLKDQSNNYNLSAQLQETGTLQQQLIALEKERDALETDVDTALARDEVLRKRKETGNRHTLYLLDRPVRRGMVPYLWALSVLFVGVGVLFFYWLTPTLLLPAGGLATDALGTSSSVLDMLSDIFSHRYTWMALFGAASVVILSLSLKIAGVFGK